MSPDINTNACPHCSRGPGQGHHVDCPQAKLDKVLRQDGINGKIEALMKAYVELPELIAITVDEQSPPGTAQLLHNLIASVRDIVEVA